MGTKIEYVDTTHLYASKYIRNSKAIGVLWAIFTICYAIIGIVAFVTPGERKLILLITIISNYYPFIFQNGLAIQTATVLVGWAYGSSASAMRYLTIAGDAGRTSSRCPPFHFR